MADRVVFMLATVPAGSVWKSTLSMYAFSERSRALCERVNGEFDALPPASSKGAAEAAARAVMARHGFAAPIVSGRYAEPVVARR